MGVAVYPRCVRLAFGVEGEARALEEQLRSEIATGDDMCRKSGEVWLGDVRLGSTPIVTADGHKLLLVRRNGKYLVCHNLASGNREEVDTEEVTNTLIQMFFLSFRPTLWSWAQECIRKLSGSKEKITLNWKQALLGQDLEQQEWASSSDMIHVWSVMRKCILTEIWWLYNRSLAEDTSKVTSKYLIQQVWLSLRLTIMLEWIQVVRSKDEGLASQFDRKWLQNGFAGTRTRQWVL